MLNRSLKPMKPALHSLSNRRYMKGITTTDIVLGYIMVILFVLVTLQSFLVLNAKTSVNYATFEAARSGIVNNAQKEKMEEAFARNMIERYGGGSDAKSISHSWGLAIKDISTPASANGAGLVIDIQNPTQEAFDDFGERMQDGRRAIPNSYLQHRSTDIGPTSQVNIQDANLLKIKITYGYALIVPIVDKLFAKTMLFLDPLGAEYYEADPVRIKLTSTALMRMHSKPIEDGNLSINDLKRKNFGAVPDDKEIEEEQDSINAELQPLPDPFALKPYVASNDLAENDSTSSGDDTEEEEDVSIDCLEDTAEEEQLTEEQSSWFKRTFVNAAAATVDFMRGLVDGALNQAEEMFDAFTNPETLTQVKELYAAYKKDPKGTTEAILQAMGDDIKKDIGRLAQCGAYDRGYIFATYIDPTRVGKILGLIKGVKIGSYDDPSSWSIPDKNDNGGLSNYEENRHDANHQNDDSDSPHLTITDVKDSNGNGKFDQEEYVEAGVKDANNDGKVDEQDHALACEISWDTQVISSFTAGTLVLSERGLIPIEQITIDDYVLAQHPVTLEQRFMRVTRLHQRRTDDIWLITYSDGSGELKQVKATSEHPFWVQGRSWTEAGALEVGDQILTSNEAAVTIEALERTGEIEQVYNFTVEGWNNYFVAESGLWVHNMATRKCKDVGNVTKGLAGVPGRVQSRINLKNSSWDHVVDRHFNPAINASQFTISKGDLRSLLQSKDVVGTPVTRTMNSADGIRYVREIDVGRNIGLDKFSNMQPTSTMTVLSDKFGNLVTATPGLIK